jgi:hypothetical protein
VQWKHFGVDEATWELEDAMRMEYPFLFLVYIYMVLKTYRAVFPQGGGECNTSFSPNTVIIFKTSCILIYEACSCVCY